LLSYRHSFHAGNFADVLKHLVLTEILDYLVRKDRPFDYIDTHAGAGVYSLKSPQATKTGEYLEGIARLTALDMPELATYLAVVRAHNPGAGITVYPGSPAIASHFLRPTDRGWLFELHGGDFPLLEKFAASRRNIRVKQADGLAGMLALVPPASRRGLVLVDPSYELDSEFRQVLAAVTAAWRKFTTGTYAIWYPVVSRRQANWLEQQFARSGVRNIQVFELARAPDSEGLGMTSSCMLVINPPWQLQDKMARVLPRLVTVLGDDGRGLWRAEQLVPE